MYLHLNISHLCVIIKNTICCDINQMHGIIESFTSLYYKKKISAAQVVFATHHPKKNFVHKCGYVKSHLVENLTVKIDQ